MEDLDLELITAIVHKWTTERSLTEMELLHLYAFMDEVDALREDLIATTDRRRMNVLIRSFWSKVQRTPHCWNWTGAKSPDGYGRLTMDKEQHYAHRLAWTLAHGIAIPQGKKIIHRCGNPQCVRPDHLTVK